MWTVRHQAGADYDNDVTIKIDIHDPDAMWTAVDGLSVPVLQTFCPSQIVLSQVRVSAPLRDRGPRQNVGKSPSYPRSISFP